MTERTTTPFDGPHGSFWVACEECGGRGSFCDGYDDEFCDIVECDRCDGNGGYWDCVDDLCAAQIDDWNW